MRVPVGTTAGAQDTHVGGQVRRVPAGSDGHDSSISHWAPFDFTTASSA